MNQETLLSSTDMEIVEGSIEVNIPAEELWKIFNMPNLWPDWNRCFYRVCNGKLEKGSRLVWAFQPIRWFYFYKMPAIAKIVELEPGKTVTWEVTALPGFYARHTYSIERIDHKRCRFSSWEKACGWSLRLMRCFWVCHFRFVRDKSLDGVRGLEKLYIQTNSLEKKSIQKRRWLGRLLAATCTFLIAVFLWFYISFVHQSAEQLSPGVYLISGGGGNSVIIKNEDRVLLIDTKFPPGSNTLRDWIRENVASKVNDIVNTHAHYDHTFGNSLYPSATIHAHNKTPMLVACSEYARTWWKLNPSGVPNSFIDNDKTIEVGSVKARLVYRKSTAHTQGDLIVVFPEQNIVVMGDIFFHGYYPFIDDKCGASLKGMIDASNELADQYPDAIFIPGHGPKATAADLRENARYLQAVLTAVSNARKMKLSEDDAVKTIDISGFKNRSWLPSFPNGGYWAEWSSHSHMIRSVYKLEEKEAFMSRQNIQSH